MRIDDENKVVWCSENLFPLLEEDDFFELDEFDKIFYLLNLSFDSRYGIPHRFETDKWKPILISIFDKYCFELEQPQKYYWRKKNEHLAWFENVDKRYLNFHIEEKDIFLHDKNSSLYVKTKFTESEARYLLKGDFDKFEKVECE